MHRFHRILAYVSLADERLVALERAASLARAHGASLTVVRVLQDGGAWSRWRSRRPDAADLRRVVEESLREALEARVAPLRAEGIEVRVDILSGTPWLELVRLVLRDGHDLVVKAAEGAARREGVFFGSTALHLIRKCPCLVWVVGGARDARAPRVLAAVDPSEEESRSALAREIVDLAASMAGDDGELHVASAWRAVGETLLQSRVRPDELANYVRAARDEARASLDKILAESRHPIEPDHVHVLKGDAREVLPALVERRRFDLVVMGSLGRVGVAGFLIGETAETLLRSVRCSVLVVKPPGFVSPVELPTDER